MMMNSFDEEALCHNGVPDAGVVGKGTKAVYDDYGCGAQGFWVPYTYGKFVNQDRQFDVKLRLWNRGSSERKA